MARPSVLILLSVLGFFAGVLRVSNAHETGVIDDINSVIVREWPGGFVGRIEVAIPRYITEWKIRIAFLRKVSFIKTNGASVEEKQRYGRSYVLRNTDCNGVLEAGDKLSFIFMATNAGRTFKGQQGAIIFRWKALCDSPCLNGECTDIDTCTCEPGWTGDMCETAICTPPCVNEGLCTAPDTCTCDNGWGGDTCAEVCSDAFGMETFDLPNDNIRSSPYLYDSAAWKARLNAPFSVWLNNDFAPVWIEADVGYLTYLTGLIIQGDGSSNFPDWITSLKVSTSPLPLMDREPTDPGEFIEDNHGQIVFKANDNYYDPVTIMFPAPIKARVVRIHPVTKADCCWQLRFEILGCSLS